MQKHICHCVSHFTCFGKRNTLLGMIQKSTAILINFLSMVRFRSDQRLHLQTRQLIGRSAKLPLQP